MEKCINCFEDNSLKNNYRDNLAKEEKLNYLAELFKIFGDANRIKILFGLSQGEMCVCDIVSFSCDSIGSISSIKDIKAI